MKKAVICNFLNSWFLLAMGLWAGSFFSGLPAQSTNLSPFHPETLSNPGTGSVRQAGARPALYQEVSRDEVKRFSMDHQATIIDARPETFYRLGHIPSALSLPHHDFEKRYSELQSTLQSHRSQPLIVYCFAIHCRESELVANSLREQGYADVRLFRGGWSDWQGGRLPEEK